MTEAIRLSYCGFKSDLLVRPGRLVTISQLRTEMTTTQVLLLFDNALSRDLYAAELQTRGRKPNKSWGEIA